jgi:hypothetical protein
MEVPLVSSLRSTVLCSVALSSLLAIVACGGSGGSEFDNGGGGNNGGASGGQASGGFGGNGDPNSSGGASSGTDPGNTSGGPACAAQEAAAARKPVKLLLILDQSGSMGDTNNGNNRAAKWVPVTTALGSFLQKDTGSQIQASMRLFPQGANNTAKCDPATYATPNVAMTTLPNGQMFMSQFVNNPTFVNTPTLAVVKATVTDAKAVAAANADSKVAIVLITDGEPTGCTDNTIQSIANEVGTIKANIPTYVIGVGASLNNLNSIAQAGAARNAFIVSVNDPAATEAEFLAAIDQIRGASIACDVAIPAPPTGQTLDPNKVNVNYTPTGKPSEQLKYDEACVAGGWHYDDKANPKNVILCPQTCNVAKADPAAKLSLEFGCVTRNINGGGGVQ